jgi:hypothetical protein
MRNGLFLTIFITFLATSCRFFDDGQPIGGFVTLKPGHFCQLGAIAISGDTIFVAGSYLAEDDPNAQIQLVHSYYAAVDTNGKLLWEKFTREPDYTRWLAIYNSQGTLYMYGKISSPLTNYVAEYYNAESNTGKLLNNYREDDTIPQLLFDCQLNAQNQFTVIISRALKGPSGACISKRNNDAVNGYTLNPNYCIEGDISCARILNDSMYMAFWGPIGTTEVVNIIKDSDSILNLAVPPLLYKYMVNDVLETAPLNYQLITTSKNEQGPCMYNLSIPDSLFGEVTCLAYWPMHGSTKALRYGNCTILAFNASDSINVTSANVVLLNPDNQVEWEYNHTGQANFLISDLKVAQNKIVVGGTYETGKEGSLMAVKILSLPNIAGCAVGN